MMNSCWNPLDFTDDLEEAEELDTRYIEDLAKKIRETAIKFGYPVKATEIPLTKRLIGREVGDDRVDLSRSSLAIITTLTVQEEVVKMRTSWEDTFVTKGRWNFCEVTSDIPTDPYQGYRHCRKWADDLSSRIKNKRDELQKPVPHEDLHKIFMEDPEWVNDDSGLIATCMEDHTSTTAKLASVALVTNDRRLARQMANSCNLSVLRVDPKDYILYAGEGFLKKPHPDLLSLKMTGVAPVDKAYLDTGSIAACSATLDEQRGTVVERLVTETGVSRGKRTTSVVLRKTDRPLKIKVLEVQHPIVRPKVWRSHSKPASTVYSSSDKSENWRRPPTSLTPSRATSWRRFNRDSEDRDP